MPLTSSEDIADLLQNARTIAMVGASDNPDRASFGVMKFLQDQGYRVIPVNPRITGEHVHGEYVWRELSQIGEPIDIVDIFRKSEAVGPIVDQAIEIGAKAVWMQLGSRGCRGSGAGGGSGSQGRHEPLPQDRIRKAGAPSHFGKYPLIQLLDSDVMEAELSPAVSVGRDRLRTSGTGHGGNHGAETFSPCRRAWQRGIDGRGAISVGSGRCRAGSNK